MLRRRLIILLTLLVGLLLAVSVAAIWLLQGVLGDLDHTGQRDAVVSDYAGDMSVTISQVEIELRKVELGRQPYLDPLIDGVQTLQRETAAFGQEYEQTLPAAKPVYEHLRGALANFTRHVGALATTQDPHLTRPHMEAALASSIELRQDILQIGQMVRQHTTDGERAAVTWFRWLVLALAIVFLLVINITVMMLLRMSNMVLRPLDELVEASRRLGREEYGCRVTVAADDEFGELAQAYNRLAEQMEANERRKLETLAQAAVTLNHELNNASAIIKLQLDLLGRQSLGDVAHKRCLQQIYDSLARMTSTLDALKRVRRIVLTGYDGKTQMLDLERSTAEEPVPSDMAAPAK